MTSTHLTGSDATTAPPVAVPGRPAASAVGGVRERPRNVRNAHLRVAVRAAFPGVSFAVRNGRRGLARVSWVGGPTREQVDDVLRAVERTPGHRWGFYLVRESTADLVAVAYLRARANRVFYYEERGPTGILITPGDVHDLTDAYGHWVDLDEGVDAATVTEAERQQAAVLFELAAGISSPAALVDAEDSAQLRKRLGAALYHHGPLIDIVLADPVSDDT